MQWLYVTVFINSVFVTCVAIGIIITNLNLKKERNEGDEIFRRLDVGKAEIKAEIKKLDNRYKEIHAELAGRRKHKQISDNEFIFGGWNRIATRRGKAVNNNFLDYVAKIAARVIVDELPEEIRTKEVIKEIVKRAECEIEEAKIDL